ncbi:MAG: hypothetical protein EOM72_13440 [Opitutae bacterium]|jgi:hypothetical protein|nr:hypothetical protein [Opitutae bacterium]
MKNPLALLAPLLLSGCMSLRPLTEPASTERLVRPRWETARATGLTYRAERLAARAETAGVGMASAAASSGSTRASAFGSGISAGQTAVYEAYENDDLRRLLRYALEDEGIVGGFDDASAVEIEGIVYKTGVTTSGWLILRNFLTLAPLCLPPYLGFPVTGTNEAIVQIRVRKDGTLIAKSEGRGEAQWYSHLEQFSVCRQEATKLAAKKAVLIAVQDLRGQK